MLGWHEAGCWGREDSGRRVPGSGVLGVARRGAGSARAGKMRRYKRQQRGSEGDSLLVPGRCQNGDPPLRSQAYRADTPPSKGHAWGPGQTLLAGSRPRSCTGHLADGGKPDVPPPLPAPSELSGTRLAGRLPSGCGANTARARPGLGAFPLWIVGVGCKGTCPWPCRRSVAGLGELQVWFRCCRRAFSAGIKR